MVRHSKNNTNSAKFTAHERSQLKSGTQTERLGRDSMKNFNACSLCLERARDPRVCTEGHIFCQVRMQLSATILAGYSVLTVAHDVGVHHQFIIIAKEGH